MLVPAVMSAREAARRASCIGTFKMFGLALHNYHNINGCFPPSMLVRPGEQALSATGPAPGSFNADGNSAGFSWRTMLLPYYEVPGLYEKLDMDTGFPYDRNPDHTLVASTICSARFDKIRNGSMSLCPSFTGADLAEAPEYAKNTSGISNYVTWALLIWPAFMEPRRGRSEVPRIPTEQSTLARRP